MNDPQNIIFTPQNGIVRNSRPYGGEDGSFYNLINCRLVPGRGKIEQVPAFKRDRTFTQGTYYAGGSQTESATLPGSLLLYINGYFYTGGQMFRKETATKQVIRQTTAPAAETVYTGCLLVVNNVTALALTLGLTLDVEMTGVAAFRWRKNGGGWTAGVPSTAGVAIDGGNATLYFLANTGFAGTETWAWTRTDHLYESGSSVDLTCDWAYAIDYVSGGFRLIFVDSSGRVLSYSTASDCVVTVGYRPVYGTHLATFQDHLYVGSYATVNTAIATSAIVGNSDLTDLDCFVSTDVNEADTKSFSPSALIGNAQESNKIRGLTVIGSQLNVYIGSRIFRGTYIGLPNVMFYEEYIPVVLVGNLYRPVSTPHGDYIITDAGLEFFDGSVLRLVSVDMSEGDLLASGNHLFGVYNFGRREVIFYVNTGGSVSLTGDKSFIIYQEYTQSWYARSASFDSDQNHHALCSIYGLLISTYPLGVITEDIDGTSNAIINDFNNGASLQLPEITLTDITRRLSRLIEFCNTYIDAYYTTATGTAYATTGITIAASTRISDSATVSYPGGALTDTITTTTLGRPLNLRGAGRVIRVRITPTVAAGKYPWGFEFNQFEIDATSATNSVQR